LDAYGLILKYKSR